jgi:hypothetical protein
MSTVDISKVDKVKLLKALWVNATPAIFFQQFGVTPPSFDEEGAKDAVKKYIDYYNGRCIKTDLSQNTARPNGYDRDYGEGSFARIVRQLEHQ